MVRKKKVSGYVAKRSGYVAHVPAYYRHIPKHYKRHKASRRGRKKKGFFDLGL